MRIGFLINPDKSLHLFPLAASPEPHVRVEVKFAGAVLVATVCQSALYAMDECGVVLTTFARIVNNMEAPDRARPLAVLAALEASKAKQVCLDAAGKLRCVDTMKANETVYTAAGDASLIPGMSATVETVEDADAMKAAALVTLKRKAALLMVDTEANQEQQDRAIAWVRAGCPLDVASNGAAPAYHQRAEVYK